MSNLNIAEDSPTTFKPGQSGNPLGRALETEEHKEKQRIKKKAVDKYIESLTDALKDISPVLKKKAIDGDMSAIKEINDRVMGKAPVDITSGGEKIQGVPICGGESVHKYTSEEKDIQTQPET